VTAHAVVHLVSRALLERTPRSRRIPGSAIVPQYMSRRIAWAAWVLVIIQVAGFVFLKPGSPRALLSNLTQIAACFTAAGFCLAASRRGRDMARTFWVLLAVSFTSYGLANGVWTYYENWRQSAVPFSPISQFLYFCYDAPLVMALFLRESEDPSGLDWQRSLDFVQMLMVAFLIYYDFLFLRALHRGLHSLELMEQAAMTNILNFVLAGAFVLRSFWGRTPLVRSLCRRASVYLVVYAFAAAVGDYALTFIHATSGAWSSLAWTVPFIVAAMLAARFDPSSETPSQVPAESWNQRTFLLKNTGLAVMPLTVWALALRAADHDRVVAYGTVIVSLVCYGTHLTISQYRNHQVVEALRASEERYRLVSKQLLQAEKMQAIGRLAGGVAHDFNNVLTVILGYAQQLLDNRTPSAEIVHRSAGHILTAGERAASLTRQLLAFGRKQLLQPTVLNLNVVLVDIDKMLRRLISENVEIVTRPAPKLGSVRADIGQIEQVILNLVINARDAMPTGGSLTLETGNADLDENYAQEHAGVRPGSYVMLAVSDTGIGMDAETQAHIFEPFFTTKEDGKGSGMGLATVYGVVQQSGGHIWVYSEPGRGSTFKLYLPRVEEAAETGAKSQAPAPTIRGTETILVAEDDRQVRDLAVAILKACGYLVLVLESALEAEHVCQQHQGSIDLLLTDVIMREMSGPDLAQRLTKLRPQTKVLFMSGYTDAAIVHQGVLDPGIAFLPKPFTPSSLAGKVRQVLDQPKA